MQERAAGYNAALQQAGFGQERYIQEQAIGSQERQALAAQAAEKERLGMQLTSQERMFLDEQRGLGERLGQQLGSQERVAALGEDSAYRRLTTQLGSDAQRQQAELASEERRAAAGLAGETDRTAITAITNANASYLDAFSRVASNDKIPATARDAYQSALNVASERNLNLLRQVSGLNIAWPTPAPPVRTTAPAPITRPTYSYRLPPR